MLKLKKLKFKNFMSFGNIEHEFDLSDNSFMLIIGENRDVTVNGSFTDSRNGTGKTSIANALSYVLYDKALGSIKKDNLVNKLNERNMQVTLEFSKNNIEYKILRGRKPNVLKFYVNNVEYDESVAQGENRETQQQIEKAIGIKYDLFKQIMVLSAQGESFLSLRVKEQRDIIEELLGITQLSEKADVLKNMIKDTQIKIDQENFKIQTLQSINEKTLNQIQKLQKISDKWDSDKKSNISDLKESISKLEILDIELEIQNHEKMKNFVLVSDQFQKLDSENKKISKELNKIEKLYKDVSDKISMATIDKKCYTCGHSLDEGHGNIIDDLMREKSSIFIDKDNLEIRKDKLTSEITSLEQQIIDIGDFEEPFYETEKEVWEHNSTIENLKSMLEKELVTINPYCEQIETLKNENLSVIDTKEIEDMKNEKTHMEFLMRILTNKDSFVRKKIIDQSLTFLNVRLDHYLTEMGLPHTVKFQNDLSVSIDLLGREYDFDNLSRGQKTRLILSLNLSFIDVFETLNFPLNMMFVDELIDNGLDNAGVDNSIKIFKEITRSSKKSVFLVSHKDEIAPRVEKTVKIIMENGFSSIEHENLD